MHSVLLFTDDAVLASGLAHVLQRTDDLTLLGTCSDTESVESLIQQTAAKILLVDVSSATSLPLASEVRKSYPEVRVCLWARQLPDELAYQAMRIGIRGILRRTLPIEDIVSCLRKISRDEVWFEERLMAGFFSNRVPSLTLRESQLITSLAQGMKNKEIAYALSLSEGTVKVYLSRLFTKLAVKDRFELALYGLRYLAPEQPAASAHFAQNQAIPQAAASQIRSSAGVGTMLLAR